jgi:hypothetical protein
MPPAYGNYRGSRQRDREKLYSQKATGRLAGGTSNLPSMGILDGQRAERLTAIKLQSKKCKKKIKNSPENTTVPPAHENYRVFRQHYIIKKQPTGKVRAGLQSEQLQL